MRMVNCSASGNFFRRSKARGVWGGWRWPIESDWVRWWWDLGAFELGRMYLENHWGDLGWVKFDFVSLLVARTVPKVAICVPDAFGWVKTIQREYHTHISVHYCPISIYIHLHPSTSTKQPRCSCRRSVPSFPAMSRIFRGAPRTVKSSPLPWSLCSRRCHGHGGHGGEWGPGWNSHKSS